MAILSAFIVYQIIEIDIDSFSLDSVYYRYEPIESVMTTSSDAAYGLDTFHQYDGLDIDGSKDFSFDIADGFDQGLNLKISGEIEGIEVEGNLTDQSLPENTIALSEVEKINLQLKGNMFYAGIGDLTLALPFGLRDNIIGIRMAVNKDTNSLGFAYAVNRGENSRETFTGEEGKQSPYVLSGRAVPGSETVYLSTGISKPVRMIREVDYNINYEQGIISFTNKRIIHDLCVIIVEYQIATENYANTYYLTDGGLDSGPFVLTALYRVSRDNKNAPLAFDLTPDEILDLETGGDSASVRHIYADSTAEGNYIIVDSHFVYAGENNGTYLVNFFYVGDNSGDYIYDPLIKAFRYLGPGLGNYTPERELPLPGRHSFYGLGCEYDKVVHIDILGSDYDHNTFSEIGDRDNQGYGTTMTVRKTWSRFGITGRYIYYDQYYQPPFAASDFDHQYQWNTEDAIHYLAYTELMFKPLDHLAIDAGYGVLNEDHQRRMIRIRPLMFELGLDMVDTLNRYYAGMKTDIKRVSLTADYQHSQTIEQANINIYYNFSNHDRLGTVNSYIADTIARGLTNTVEWISRPLSISIGQRWYNDTAYVFGNAAFRFYRYGWTINSSLEQSQRYWQKRDEQYVRVTEGQGDYVYDPVTGTYLEKPGGNYIRRLVLLPEYDRVISRNIAIEGGYSITAFDLTGRFRYIDETNFKSINTQLINSVTLSDIDVEIDISQETSDDQRYAIAGIWTRYRHLSLVPYYRRLIVHFNAGDKIEKLDEFMKEKKSETGGSIAYRIGDIITVQPQVGYYHNTFYSEFFPDLDVIMHKPAVNMLITLPLIEKGRAELSGDLNYRFFNADSVPYFYTASEPPGLEKIITVTFSFNAGPNTLVNFNYQLNMPPDNDLRHDFKMQARINF